MVFGKSPEIGPAAAFNSADTEIKEQKNFVEGWIRQGKIKKEEIDKVATDGVTKVSFIGDIAWAKTRNWGEGLSSPSFYLTKDELMNLKQGENCRYLLDFPVFGFENEEGKFIVCSEAARKFLAPDKDKAEEIELREAA